MYLCWQLAESHIMPGMNSSNTGWNTSWKQIKIASIRLVELNLECHSM